MRPLVTTAALVLALGSLSAQGVAPRSIPALAEADGRFATLLAAIGAAELGEALSGGEWTVLAPTDAAFGTLPDGTLAELLLPRNQPRLVAILKHHVIPGRMDARSLIGARTATTLEGTTLAVDIDAGRMTVDDAAVLATDLAASNGWVHVIDRVLIPPMPTPMDPAARCRALLEMAVERGAPLFNQGQPGASVAIYEIAARAVSDLAPDDVAGMLGSSLEDAIARASDEADVRKKAWALRRGIESAWRKLGARVEGATTVSTASPSPELPSARDRLDRAVTILTIGLVDGSTPKQLEDAADQAIRVLGPDSRSARRLSAAIAKPVTLRRVALELRDDLDFTPTVEAATPTGFPTFTTVGEVEVKEYPGYRMARSAMSGRSNGAFFRLFNHIKKNDFAMTAPVQMDYAEQAASMAFLYGPGVEGKLGTDGSVEVVDVAATTVISIGVRGRLNDARIGAGREALQTWLAGQDRYEASGSFRTMGWNSPFVPADQQYSEVQIPVTEARGAID